MFSPNSAHNFWKKKSVSFSQLNCRIAGNSLNLQLFFRLFNFFSFNKIELWWAAKYVFVCGNW